LRGTEQAISSGGGGSGISQPPRVGSAQR